MAVLTYFSHFSKVLLGLFHVTCADLGFFTPAKSSRFQAKRADVALQLWEVLPWDPLAMENLQLFPWIPGISWGKKGLELVPGSRIANRESLVRPWHGAEFLGQTSRILTEF